MPIVATVGRGSLKSRSLIIFIYAVLILGSVTTVYPFLIMVATSVTSHTDYERYRLIPAYLYDDGALMAKYLQEKYKTSQFDIFKLRYEVREPYEEMIAGQKITRKYGRFAELADSFEKFDLEDKSLRRRLRDWHEFKRALPPRFKDTYFHAYLVPIGEAQVGFQEFLRRRYATPRDADEAIGEHNDSYLAVYPPFEAYERHAWYPPDDGKNREWALYRRQMPQRMINVMTVEPLWQDYLQEKYAGLEQLNEAWGAGYEYFWRIPFETSRPAGPEGRDWETFVRRVMPMLYARLDVERCRESYIAYLKDTYGTVEKYNGKTGDNAASFETVTLPERMPRKALALLNWQEYFERHAPIECIRIDSADVRFAEFLRREYGDIATLNASYESDYADFDEVEPPWREEDFRDLWERRRAVRLNFLTRNYVYVLKAVFLQGRPLINTFIFVTLAVLSQISVNPLAAYALSRYRLSYSSKVLIFLLATMAFPPAVTMIPNFLMIKDLGLMNTFGALLLPGLANGYFVFLLKGFFDSLPQELYEAASIDGASEFRMFWTITLPLSLPVLAVISLFAFGGAYGSFLWAFTTCQDPKMWTLMVFLHQFQQGVRAAPYLIMAALVVAAIPTVVVFLSAQKVLMRGIVVPTMK